MEVNLKDVAVKRMDLFEYEKYFKEALKSQEHPNFRIIFYKKTQTGIEFSFSWDNFIIVVEAPYPDILKIYHDQNLNVADVVLSDKEDHPILLKFYADYLHGRGIPEK